MKVILEWDGDRNKLFEEENFRLEDSIIWLMDYGEGSMDTTTHNGIKITMVGREV